MIKLSRIAATSLCTVSVFLLALSASPMTVLAAGGGGSVTHPGPGGTTPVDVNTTAQQAACEGSGGTWDGNTATCTTPGSTRTVASTIRDIANILIFIVGAVAVLMVIVGGLRYTFAQGDNAAITAAKNTILYAIVGVVVAVAAYGIVSFVTSTIK